MKNESEEVESTITNNKYNLLLRKSRSYKSCKVAVIDYDFENASKSQSFKRTNGHSLVVKPNSHLPVCLVPSSKISHTPKQKKINFIETDSYQSSDIFNKNRNEDDEKLKQFQLRMQNMDRRWQQLRIENDSNHCWQDRLGHAFKKIQTGYQQLEERYLIE